MVGQNAIWKSVSKYHDTTSEVGKRHQQDLRYTALILRNELTQWLRKGRGTGKFSMIDEIIRVSNVVEETTLTRTKLASLECHYKTFLVHAHFEEGADYQHMHRLPNKTKSFKDLGLKKDYVKEAAMTMVLEMHHLDQINRKEMRPDEDLGLIDLDELRERVLKNVNDWKP